MVSSSAVPSGSPETGDRISGQPVLLSSALSANLTKSISFMGEDGQTKIAKVSDEKPV